MQLYQAMTLRTEHGQFAMNIGDTSILDQVYLDDDDSQASNDDDRDLEDDLDNLMASTAQAGKPRGADPKQLSKIWRISHEDAKKRIDVTTQASV